MQLNSQFDYQEFLKNSWQKTPKILRNFLSYEQLITPDELAGLACESFAESRLVQKSPQKNVEHGPFLEDLFEELPSEDWTLLVQSVDLYDEHTRHIKKLFDFIPGWRLDDIMVSFATPGGGVGPHFDHYDVFLIQGEGKRLWQLGETCDHNTPINKSSQLNLLSDFSVKEEFILEKGDALYIPPHISHNGIALTDSLCFSVGFRAPSVYEMSPQFNGNKKESNNPFHRFKNSDSPDKQKYCWEITESDLKEAFKISSLEDYEGFVRLFGTLVTEPRNKELFDNNYPIDSLADLWSVIAGKGKVCLHPASRFAFCILQSLGLVFLFSDGRTYPISINEASLAKEMSESLFFEGFIAKYQTSECANVILDMIRFGSIEILD